MEVLKYPDARLLKPCKEVTVFGPELVVLLESMWETMIKERGMGMAANQVGLEYRMFTMSYRAQKLFVVNPTIVESSKNPSDLAEGCLSAPGQMIKLYRPNWVKLSFQNEKGEKLNATFTDIHAVCVQHEIEHLDGKSFLQNKAIPKSMRKFLAEKWGLKI
jgi:peptide deformylase